MAVLVTGQEIVQRTPQQELVARVRGDAFREQVAMALPPNVTTERFVRVATTALLANADIAKLDHVSVLTAMVQCAAMGLLPDGKQAAITPRGNQAVLVPMIQGFRDIAADHGWTLRTAVVYSNDEFRHAVVDGEESIAHYPVRPGAERGELIASYAIAKHRDGRRMQVVLHPDDIAKRRASASTQNVWNNHPAAMWEKSAGRDLFAQLGFGELDERVTRILEASDVAPAEAARLMYGEPRTETPAAPAALPAGTDAQTTERTTTSPPPPAEQSDVGAAQQAAAATTSPAAAAPGTTEDEPSLDDEQQSAFVQPAGVGDDEITLAAKQAAMFKPPNGANQHLTLSEILAVGGRGEGWFRDRLDKVTEPAEYVQALWNFCRVFAPEIFQAALAKKELQS
jgi:recombination protein RecT